MRPGKASVAKYAVVRSDSEPYDGSLTGMGEDGTSDQDEISLLIAE
jgi:hypothetical protein